MSNRPFEQFGGERPGSDQQRLPLEWDDDREEAAAAEEEEDVDDVPFDVDPVPEGDAAEALDGHEAVAGYEAVDEDLADAPADEVREANDRNDRNDANEGNDRNEALPGRRERGPDPGVSMEGRDRSAAGDGASGKDGGASRTFRLGEPSVSAGEMLLEARGVAGLSIDDVCRRTNISRGFVEAVETNNAEGLPPPFYLRSHVQKLCQLYEIDPEPVLERFESLSGAGARSASDHGRFAVEAREADENSGRLEHRLLRREDLTQDQVLRHLKWGTLGAAALVVILIVVAAGVRVLGPDPATETGVEVAPPTAATEELTVEDLMPPQQLPMHELPVPVP